MMFKIVFLMGCLSAALAHPAYFHDRSVARSCMEHPVKPAGGHLVPKTDVSITVTAKQRDQAFREVCPGETYTLYVGFGGEERSALVTVSGGTLKQANVPGCSAAMTTPGEVLVTSLSSQWEVPCSLLGRVEVKVTSAKGATGAWLKNSAGFTILPISKCPGYNKCKAESQVPAIKPPRPSVPKDQGALSPMIFAVNQPTGLGGAVAAQSGGLSTLGHMCSPSDWGYQCSLPLADGVLLHYSYGGVPPLNVCTNKTKLDNAGKNSKNLMHFLMETEQQGYAAVGFPLAPGRMVPADAVIAQLDNTTGVIKVQSYRLTAKSAAGVRMVPGWATGMGAVQHGAGSSGKRALMVCFSRPALAKPSLVPHLDPSMVSIIWSSHSKGTLTDRHDKDGALIINMLSGQHAVLFTHDSTTVRQNYIMHIAHGAAMIAGLCFLLPLAGLIARHRWIFTLSDKVYDPHAKGMWVWLHLVASMLGCIAALGSYVMAMLLWFRKHSLGADRHLLYAPHCELGTGVAAMVVVQLLVSSMRPCVPSKHFYTWRLLHNMWGWTTVAAGVANCVLGTFLMRDLIGFRWLTWLLPVVGSAGGLFAIGMLLEVPRMRRVRQVCWWDRDGYSDTFSRSSKLNTIDIDGRTTIGTAVTSFAGSERGTSTASPRATNDTEVAPTR